VKRLSIGYLVPGHHLMRTAGPSRNVLSLADALGRHADLTVGFRGALEQPTSSNYDVVELDPGSAPSEAVDDAAVRGMSMGDLRAYMDTLQTFVQRHDFDVVLEKSWLLSGYLASLYRERDTPTAVVENLVRVWTKGLRTPGDILGWARHRAVRTAVGRWMRQANLIIAETVPLANALVGHLDVRSVEVVGLGVDHGRFQPGDRGAARKALGLDPVVPLLLYFGVLDRTHDLTGVLGALRELDAPPALHIVGDGEERENYAELAAGLPVVFHGRVPHEEVAPFIHAADLCVAPYDRGAFPDGEVAYSTLKIPEAMACGRAVATVHGIHTGALIEDGVSGLLTDNTASAWASLLRALPPLRTLDEMGARAAQRAASITWEGTAERYLALCEGLASEYDGPSAG
jgi:glycosyltransferase involved in cell wall biosynthesis